MSASLTGVGTIASAVGTAFAGESYGGRIEIGRKNVEALGLELERVRTKCGSEPFPSDCGHEATQLREFCISVADSSQLAVRERHETTGNPANPPTGGVDGVTRPVPNQGAAADPATSISPSTPPSPTGSPAPTP